MVLIYMIRLVLTMLSLAYKRPNSTEVYVEVRTQTWSLEVRYDRKTSS